VLHRAFAPLFEPDISLTGSVRSNSIADRQVLMSMSLLESKKLHVAYQIDTANQSPKCYSWQT
jgi:hypothetical protein